MKYPPSFLSPLLAQAKLRFSENSSGGSTNYCENTMTRNSNVSETSTFLKEEPSDAIEEMPSYKKHGYLEFLETRGLAR
jgi:hypothetical protein